MAKLSIEEIIASVKEMTVVELNDLVKAIENEFGVTAAAPVGGGTVVVEEEEVAKGPANKVFIPFDATKLVDNAPSNLKENISPAEAEGHKATLVEAGAEVEIK